MEKWLDSFRLARLLADYRAEWRWRRSDRSGPLPSRTKRALLGRYARAFGAEILVETGSYLGDTVAALRRNFEHVYSIELSVELARRARDRFRSAPNVTIIQGDSGTVLQELVGRLNAPTMFWLDGHYSGSDTAMGSMSTPVISELDAVLSHPLPGHVVLIDDAAWLDAELGGNGLDEIRERILTAKPHWTVEVRNDILRAHAPAVISRQDVQARV